MTGARWRPGVNVYAGGRVFAPQPTSSAVVSIIVSDLTNWNVTKGGFLNNRKIFKFPFSLEIYFYN